MPTFLYACSSNTTFLSNTTEYEDRTFGAHSACLLESAPGSVIDTETPPELSYVFHCILFKDQLHANILQPQNEK